MTIVNVESDRSSIWRRHSTIVFWLLACAVCWAAYLAMQVISENPNWPNGEILFEVALQVAKHSPSAVALAIAWCFYGLPGFRNLLGTLLIWNVPRRWYAAVILGPLSLYLTVIALWSIVKGQAWSSVGAPAIANLLALFIFKFFGAGIGEEIGWRGWALSRLLRGHSPLVASLWVGFGWGLWHAPIYFVPVGGLNPSDLPLKVFYFMMASIVFTWVYQRTGGSTLIAAILHAANNAIGPWGDQLCFIPTDDILAMYILVSLMTALAAMLVVSGRVTWRRSTLPEPN